MGVQYEGIGSVYEVQSCKIVSRGTSYSLVQNHLLYDISFRHNTLRHRQTQTDGQTDDIIIIAILIYMYSQSPLKLSY